MRKTYSAVLLTALTAILLGIGAPSAHAQRRVQLVNFDTTSWRYLNNGTDQGTAWRARTFNDAGWPAGPGLLGVEAGAYPYPFNTSWSPYNPAIITYYFRAHFNMTAQDFVWPLTLQMSNLVDDGCLVYLNSNNVAAIRVAQNAGFMVQATGGPAAEGAYEPPINISTNGLLVGDNVIAVEVHQSGTASTDITMGLSLTAIVPTTMVITSQPQNQTTTAGVAANLSVGLSGGPGLYQWQTNNGAGTFVNMLGANSTNSSFPATAAGTWTVRFVASNGLGMVISSNATVVVTADNSGPLMLSANVLEEPTRTNRIQIAWNENLQSTPGSPTLLASNYTVVMFPSNIVVGVSNVQYNPGTFPQPDIPPTVTLTMNSTNWHVRSNYCVFVNNVRDFRNNTIAPNSRICVSWPVTTNVMQMSDLDAWSYFDSHLIAMSFLNTNVYLGNWMGTNYTPDPQLWGLGTGILWKEPSTPTFQPCAGDFLGTPVSIQDNPTLFRRTFTLPAGAASSGTVQLKLRYMLDDGAVFFMNGREFLQANMGGRAAGTPITDATLGGASVANPTCTTNDNFSLPASVPLFPGQNWMAVAVCQENPLPGNGADDVAFGLEMDVRMYGSSPALTSTTSTNLLPRILPSKPTPTTMRMFWTNGFGARSNGFGFTVVSSPTLRNATWTEVQPIQMSGTLNSSNIFTSTAIISNVPTSGPQLFYRLRRVQPLP